MMTLERLALDRAWYDNLEKYSMARLRAERRCCCRIPNVPTRLGHWHTHVYCGEQGSHGVGVPTTQGTDGNWYCPIHLNQRESSIPFTRAHLEAYRHEKAISNAAGATGC
ncbi:hypothetical protein LJ737_04400 [Hymenobacter sp. 15J16-1T3B]|uniref:hypothetical protein n=1 Tax=Hymenobacter sp. 15J16-1T3B TaxID=2886941 RepID=UPI001D0FFA2A|nr:hypothetical protein [Hymenobacter sp. 15J16-1T3B]MCC3156464.1 hypothetical protein [Hymenobacter sp. 15J16-1T3B]